MKGQAELLEVFLALQIPDVKEEEENIFQTSWISQVKHSSADNTTPITKLL